MKCIRSLTIQLHEKISATNVIQLADETKHILNKGLVVRIGRNDTTSQHTVCSKTTTNRDSSSTTTTTKITIDLSPSPTNTRSRKEFGFPNYSAHSFKSTSLILNTIRAENEKCRSMESAQNYRKCAIPQELEALRKLYEDVMSDNEADLEVQSLMSKITESESDRLDEDCSSVVSGSWSKMTAYKNVDRYLRKAEKSLGYQNGVVQKAHAHIDKGTYSLRK